MQAPHVHVTAEPFILRTDKTEKAKGIVSSKLNSLSIKTKYITRKKCLLKTQLTQKVQKQQKHA